MTSPLPLSPAQRADALSYSDERNWQGGTPVRPKVTPNAPVQSPAWWVARLYARLAARRSTTEFYDAYYRGDHPLPWLAPQAHVEFRRILAMSRSNYMGLVVDAKAERLQVEGFRVAPVTPLAQDGSFVRPTLPDEADDNLWRIWQANDLDSESDQAFLEALIGGQSYLLVAPNPDDSATPLITVEHASQTIVEYAPGTGRRQVAAGLKVWNDDWTGELHATLYMPNALYKRRAPLPKTGVVSSPEWTEREPDSLNPLGFVPIVELANAPRMLSGGRSMLADVTDIQDRINKTIADRLITQDFGAFPQKWIAGWPDEDDDGNPTPAINVGRDRAITTSVSAESVRFGQFDAAPLDPYSAAKREDVKDIASRTRTPAQDLLGELSNVNGSTVEAVQAGHIAVIKQMSRHFGQGLERAMTYALRTAGQPVPAAMETIWAHPEYRTDGERSDAILKRVQGKLTSVRQAREDYGYSATQIKRLEQDDADQASRVGLGDLGGLFDAPQQ